MLIRKIFFQIIKQIHHNSAQCKEETFPFLGKRQKNCDHGTKVQKYMKKYNLCILDLHKVAKDNQMRRTADRQKFCNSLDQTQNQSFYY